MYLTLKPNFLSQLGLFPMHFTFLRVNQNNNKVNPVPSKDSNRYLLCIYHVGTLYKHCQGL